MQLHRLKGNRDIHILSLLSFSNVRHVHLVEVLKYFTKKKDDQNPKHIFLFIIHDIFLTYFKQYCMHVCKVCS